MESFSDGRSTLKNEIPHFEELDGIFSIERSSTGQIYIQQQLDSFGHCTLDTSLLQKNIFSSEFSTNSETKVPYCHIPSNTNFVSSDKRFIVINNDTKVSDLGFDSIGVTDKPIAETTRIITEMYELGLADFYTFDNKKRSSVGVGEKRKIDSADSKMKITVHSMHEGHKEVTIDPNSLPTITLGWSTNDCNEYSHNLSTIAGTIKPFKRDGGLPRQILLKLIELVEYVLKILPTESIFDPAECGSKNIESGRRRMMSELKEFLGGDGDASNFRAEGIAILIPASVGFHKDSVNCNMPGMQTVLSINANIPINNRTFRSGNKSKVRQWLNLNEYNESHPCSIILYSRQPVGSYCEKVESTRLFAEKDPVRKCLAWALVDRVGSVCDYRSSIWNNNCYPKLFRKHSSIRKNSVFKSRIWKTPASYDKMVSCNYPTFALQCSKPNYYNSNLTYNFGK